MSQPYPGLIKSESLSENLDTCKGTDTKICIFGLHKKITYYHSFTSGWPVFPAPLVKETIFTPLYILASFVKDKVLVLVFKTINLISFCTVNISTRLFKKHLLWLIKCKDCTCYYASFLSYIFSQGTCFNTFILRTFKSNSR